MLAVLLMPSVGLAQGINTNVALAVAEDEAIFRSQLRYRRATENSSETGRELDALVAPQTLVYGVTPQLTAFATLPILAQRSAAPSSGYTAQRRAPLQASRSLCQSSARDDQTFRKTPPESVRLHRLVRRR